MPTSLMVVSDAELVSSTGRRKPAAHSQYSLINTARVFAATSRGIGIGTFSTSLNMWITGHFGMICEMMAALLGRENSILFEYTSPEPLASMIQKHQIELGMLPPRVLHALGDVEGRADLSSLRRVFTAGAAIPEHTRLALSRMMRGGDFLSYYGSTECSAVSSLPIDERTQHDPKSVGRVLEGVEIQIRDPSSGQVLGHGQTGSVFVKSPATFCGYLGDAEATKEVITEDGWVRPGDLGYTDADGTLYISGREKDVLRVRGRSVLPAEIESCLQEELGHIVKEIAVVGKAHVDAGEIPCAFISLTDRKEDFDPAMIHSIVARRLNPVNQLEGGIAVMDALPRNTVGKIDKMALREIANATTGSK